MRECINGKLKNQEYSILRSELLKFYQNYLTDSQLFRNTHILSELFNKFTETYIINTET